MHTDAISTRSHTVSTRVRNAYTIAHTDSHRQTRTHTHAHTSSAASGTAGPGCPSPAACAAAGGSAPPCRSPPPSRPSSSAPPHLAAWRWPPASGRSRPGLLTPPPQGEVGTCLTQPPPGLRGSPEIHRGSARGWGVVEIITSIKPPPALFSSFLRTGGFSPDIIWAGSHLPLSYHFGNI